MRSSALLPALLLLAACSDDGLNGTPCDEKVDNSCNSETMFCHHAGVCVPCSQSLSGTDRFLNCDGNNFNECEWRGIDCSGRTCVACYSPRCCDNGTCIESGAACSTGGTCSNGKCTTCPNCEPPRCCENGVCLEHGDDCPSGGKCANGACTPPPTTCTNCISPDCCDGTICRKEGEDCTTEGTVCKGGYCKSMTCPACEPPSCCDEGTCRSEGQDCNASNTTCYDGNCVNTDITCTMIFNWTNGTITAGYKEDGEEKYTYMDVHSATNAGMILRVQFFHAEGIEPPKTLSLTAIKLADCAAVTACAKLGASCSGGFDGCSKIYFAQDGTLKITEADPVASGGKMTANLTAVEFRPWDTTDDEEIIGGDCYEIGVANITASW